MQGCGGRREWQVVLLLLLFVLVSSSENWELLGDLLILSYYGSFFPHS